MKGPTRAQLDAWRAKSKPLTRGPGPTVDPDRYDQQRRRNGSTLRPRAEHVAGYYRDVRRPLVADLIRRIGVCQAPTLFALTGEDDPLPRCAGPLDVHERRRRSQGGSLENDDNLLVVCRAHNQGAADSHRGDSYHLAGLVVFEGDDGYDTLGARRGERRQR